MDGNIIFKRNSLAYPYKIFMLILVLVASYVFLGCNHGFVPDEARKRWGFEKTEEQNINYQKSLSYSEAIKSKINPKNHWRVLNQIMYYLLNKKAQGQSDSQAKSYLNQLNSKDENNSLHFIDDSTRVAQIYERAFISENMKLIRETPNDFIYKHLAQVILPQVLSLGGFEQVIGLNEWGEKIVEAGPFQDIRRGVEYIEATSMSNGLTYRATENPNTFELFVSYVGIDSNDKFDSPEYPLGAGLPPPRGKFIEAVESKLLLKEEERKVYIPIDYENSFDISQIGLVKLPCPNSNALWINNLVPNAQQLFYNGIWDGNRIVIDVSADVSEFVDSKGIAEFDLRYVITGLKNSSIMLADQTVHVQDQVSTKGGFIKRVITKSFQSYDSCNVSVILTNGIKALRHDSLITLNPGYSPLEILNKDVQGIGFSGIPSFHIGNLKGGENYQLFIPFNGLIKRPEDSVYNGFINIFLTTSNENKGIVLLDKNFTWEWADSIKIEEKIYPTKEHVTSMYGNNFLKSFEIKSKYSGGYYIVDVKIPKVQTPMGKYDIGAEFYRFIDSKNTAVEKIGEAFKTCTIE